AAAQASFAVAPAAEWVICRSTSSGRSLAKTSASSVAAAQASFAVAPAAEWVICRSTSSGRSLAKTSA
ncbi:hypothetical protein G7B21_29455, partial [Klebsiella pneumoniae]|nr:hypothetical protein [Klebsiella pneumoniae]